MATINPYLNFKGNAEEAFNFYKAVFGGEFLAVHRFKDIPEGKKLSAADQEKIMHIALPIGNNILMATDALESMGQKLTLGDNHSISISTDSEAETDKLFNALAAGGKINMPLEKASWGDYFGMLTDKFGTHWMVSYTYPQQSQARAQDTAQVTHG